MSRNEGNADRIIRILLAVVIFAVGLATQSWLGLIGFVPLLTGLMGWCPLYSIFGLSTCPVKTE